MAKKDSSFAQNIFTRLRATPRRRYVELLGIGLVLFVILAIATIATPYQRPASERDVLFYAGSEAQAQEVTYYRAEVAELGDQVRVTLQDGALAGTTQPLSGAPDALTRYMQPGDTIIVAMRSVADEYVYLDQLRIPALGIILAIFIGLVLLVGRWRGLTSLAGLGVSVLVIGWQVIPMVLAGYDTFWTIVLGAFIIAATSIFVAHGLKLRTLISVCCIIFLLVVVCALSYFAVWLTALTGMNSETAYYLQLHNTDIDIRGILIGGIIIACLGVLDDIVTAQVAVVEELHRAQPKANMLEVLRGATSVGGEHIAALVNTLALAYVGASLPIIISMASAESSSLFMILNSEYIATEVVRTLVASSGLVLAVPLSTYVATVSYKYIIPRMVQSKS